MLNFRGNIKYSYQGHVVLIVKILWFWLARAEKLAVISKITDLPKRTFTLLGLWILVSWS